jgi:tricorn protease
LVWKAHFIPLLCLLKDDLDMAAGYYRFPTIYQEKIVFVSEDDLWSVGIQGGIARRLTSNLGEVTYPHFSPDGVWLALVGCEEGASEIYVMPAEGGNARRLTYLSSSCWVVGWTPDSNRILFASNYGQVVNREYALFSVSVAATNGEVTPLPYGPAQSISYGPSGQAVLGRNMGEDPAYWKRYRGGTTGHLWIDRNGNGHFERFLNDLRGNLASPMWIAPSAGATESGAALANRIFFASDHEGLSNLYSCRPDAQDLRRHTDHADYYVRNPTTDGRRIVYHVGADLYVYDVTAEREERVEIDCRSPRVQRNRKFVDVGRFLEFATLHPSGRALSATVRGKLFAFYNYDGPVIQMGQRDGVRYRLPDWLHDHRNMVVISDAQGEETLEIHNADPEQPLRRLDGLDLGRAVELKASPTHEKVALSNHRHELLLVDIPSGAVTVVERNPHRLIQGFDWSPDGRWLAYSSAINSKSTAIRLYRLPDPEAADESLRQGSTHTITRPVLRDVRPSFDPEGNFLYFLSYREFSPVYDALGFDLSFPKGMRPYLVTLRADILNPFVPHPELEEDEGAAKPDEDDAQPDNPPGDASGQADPAEPKAPDDEEGAEEGDSEEEEGPAEADEEGGQEEDETEEEDAEARARHLFFQRRRAGEGAPQPAANDQPKPIGRGEGEKGPKKSKKGPRRLRIDLQGIEQRIMAFPVPEGRYTEIAGIPGKAFFIEQPVQGPMDGDEKWDDDPPATGVLRCYHFKEYKSETLLENINWFRLSRNRKKLLYGSNRRLRVFTANEKPPHDGNHPRKTGWIDLNRIKVSVDPQSEWEQMFREAWRLQRDHFWTADMADIDWQAVYQRYFPLIQRVSTRREFSDLLWEMQGELGTSHAYEMGGDYRWRPYYGQGFLGASLTWDGAANGYRLGELVLGDPWKTNASTPLAGPGLDIQPGDLLIAINGQRLSAEVGPAQLLVNQAGQEVLLTLAARPTPPADQSTARNGQTGPTAKSSVEPPAEPAVEPALGAPSDPAGEATIEAAKPSVEGATPEEQKEGATLVRNHHRYTVVRTLYSETPARYRAWVERNRQMVRSKTDGRVGYIHIPDMGARGYAEFQRSYLAEVDCDALIVDVRYNAGGHVSELILEKLARRRIGYDLSRWGGLSPYPSDSVGGPLIALTNEHAASDGDIFCHSFKLLKLGPLIGKRTWGGVIGYSARQVLVDGTLTTQPEYSTWFEDVGWNIENYGTDPDIEVDITPQDYAAGRDPQLERAIAEILRLLAEKPLVKPDLTQRPSRALPQLPPRR